MNRGKNGKQCILTFLPPKISCDFWSWWDQGGYMWVLPAKFGGQTYCFLPNQRMSHNFLLKSFNYPVLVYFLSCFCCIVAQDLPLQTAIMQQHWGNPAEQLIKWNVMWTTQDKSTTNALWWHQFHVAECINTHKSTVASDSLIRCYNNRNTVECELNLQYPLVVNPFI